MRLVLLCLCLLPLLFPAAAHIGWNAIDDKAHAAEESELEADLL